MAGTGPSVDDAQQARLARFGAQADQVRVLVLGALNIDILLQVQRFPEPDSAITVDAVIRCPGGHAGNCATGLARLGATVRILAAVGADDDGDLLVEDLRASGVDTARVQRSRAAATGRVFIPTAGNEHYMLLARGANERLDIDLDSEIAAFAPTAIVIFDPPHSVLDQVAALDGHGAAGLRRYWCPGPVNARDGDGLAARLAAAVDVIVVNSGERSAMDGLLGGVAAEVVTTRGARGSELVDGGDCVFAAARNIDVADAVGSGDAFLAAYVVARETGFDAPDRLALANGYGSLAARSAGARAGLLSADALLRFVAGEG